MNGGEPLSTPTQSSSALLIVRVASNARACSRRRSRPNKWPGTDDTAHIVLHPSATESLFPLFHASLPAFRDPRSCTYLPFPLCRYFQRQYHINMYTLLNSGRVNLVYVLAYEYININHGNVDRILKDAWQRSEIISISPRSKFYWLWHARAHGENLLCIIVAVTRNMSVIK